MFPCREEIGNRGFFEDHELPRVLDHYGEFRPSRLIFSLQKPFRGRKKAYRVTENFAVFDFRCSIYKKTLSKDLNRERERERHSWSRKYFSPFDQIPSNFSFNNNDREKGMAAIA